MSADTARYVMAASSYGFTVSGALIVVLAGGAAVVGLRHHVFPRWLSMVAAVTAVLALIGSVSIIERDPTGPLSTIASLGMDRAVRLDPRHSLGHAASRHRT